MSEKEKALAGLVFMRGDPDLRQKREWAEEMCFQLNTISPKDTEKRESVLTERLLYIVTAYARRTATYR